MLLSRKSELVTVTEGEVCYCHRGWSVSLLRMVECDVTEDGVCHCHGEWSVSVSRMVECVVVMEGGVCHRHIE